MKCIACEKELDNIDPKGICFNQGCLLYGMRPHERREIENTVAEVRAAAWQSGYDAAREQLERTFDDPNSIHRLYRDYEVADIVRSMTPETKP